MSGTEPSQGGLPLYSEHPDNLFTFLGAGGAYEMNVYEPVTQLCPTDLCPRTNESFMARMSSLSDDLSIIYRHVVLPDALSDDLPSVTETWQDFGKAHAEEELAAKPLVLKGDADIDGTVGRQLWQDQRFQTEQYVDSIEPTTEPTLFFLHAMLPHSPWRFLPSGRQYGDALGIDGLADDKWGGDEFLVEQGWQRHLLQTGLVDRLLGELIDQAEGRRPLREVAHHRHRRPRGELPAERPPPRDHRDEHRGHCQRAAHHQAPRRAPGR